VAVEVLSVCTIASMLRVSEKLNVLPVPTSSSVESDAITIGAESAKLLSPMNIFPFAALTFPEIRECEMLRYPSLLFTATEFSLVSALSTMLSEPPLLSTSASLVARRRRLPCDATERTTSTLESESEPPAPTNANA
jgi:hypothetical protein